MGQEEQPRKGTFPKYEMIINGKAEFLRLSEAARAYDNGFVKVSFGKIVLDENFNTRQMTDADRALISDAADEYSASK